jgi:hypothetical protein
MPSPVPASQLSRTIVASNRGLNIQSVGDGIVFEDNVLSGTGTATDVIIVDDNATNAAVFPVWVTAAGTVPEFISTLSFSFNPFTGLVAAYTFTQAPADNSNKLASTAYVDAAVAVGGFVWYEVTGPTGMAVNSGYVANNSSLVILTLPAVAVFGARVRVVGKGAGGWKIAQNAGQTVHFGDKQTTVGAAGFLASQNTFDAIELLCTTATTNWTELSAQGNITVT